jgi:hypothetical protein
MNLFTVEQARRAYPKISPDLGSDGLRPFAVIRPDGPEFKVRVLALVNAGDRASLDVLILRGEGFEFLGWRATTRHGGFVVGHDDAPLCELAFGDLAFAPDAGEAVPAWYALVLDARHAHGRRLLS